MLLGYNTNGLVHHRLDQALELLHDEGFQAVALTPDTCHLDPFRVSAAEVDRIAGLLDALGLVSVIETGARFLLDPRRKHRPNLLELDPGQRRIRLEYLQRCLQIAEDLGAAALSFWAGARPEETPEARAFELLAAGISELLPEAERRGVALALEPEPGMLVETVAQATAVIRSLGGSADLGLTVDIGHLLVTGEGGPDEVLRSVETPLHQVHIEDIRGGVHEHLPPGDGELDFPGLWRALEGIGYQGPVCFELSRSSHAAPDMLRRARAAFSTR